MCFAFLEFIAASTRSPIPVAHSGGETDLLDDALVGTSPCAGMLFPLFCLLCPAFSFADVGTHAF